MIQLQLSQRALDQDLPLSVSSIALNTSLTKIQIKDIM